MVVPSSGCLPDMVAVFVVGVVSLGEYGIPRADGETSQVLVQVAGMGCGSQP